MFIERLRLRGFKSFGSPVDLPLSPGFTAIVGPNGSGKSNLLDALRWVLGEAGNQRLRVVKQGDLLFAGSVTMPAAGRAEVSILLSGADAPSSCLIKRSYSPDTGTILTVDGSRIRLSDLDEVKRTWRLEGDQFAFIGQGEVAEAVHQRPANRRAHLEVLFGIDLFRKSRNETCAKLASASESSLHLSALAAELENRRREIAPAVERARAARGIQGELTDFRKLYYFWRRRQLESALESLKKELHSSLEREALLLFWERLWGSARSDAARRGEEEQVRLNELIARREGLLSRREGLGRGCFASATSIKELLSRRRQLAEELSQESSRASSLETEIEGLRGRESEIADAVAALNTERERMLDRMTEQRRAMEEEAAHRERISASVASLSGELEALESRILSRRSFLSSSSGDIERAGEALQSASEALRSVEGRISLLQAKEPSLVEAHNDALARCGVTSGNLQSARKEASALERTLEDLRAEEDSAYPEPVRFLSAATRLGRLPVSMSVAAEAFSCPRRIAPALEAYLGGRQFWILVNDMEEAGRCIEMLKERRAGRATFLPIERSRPRYPQHRFTLPDRGVVGWAAELITPEPRWTQAVMHLLGDLLVVEGYEEGASLVERGASFPIATLDGEVFATGGTVSGGRSRSSAGAIERRNRTAEVEGRMAELKRRVEELSRALEEGEALERLRADERGECSRALREAEKEREECSSRFDAERERMDRLVGARDSGSDELGEWEKRKVELEARIAALSAELSPVSRDGDPAALSDELSRIGSEAALFTERLSSARALLERSEEDLRRSVERRSTLALEERASFAREREERERLVQRGREQYALFIELGSITEEIGAAGDMERSCAARAAAVSSRATAAAERVASLKVRMEALERRIAEADRDLSALIDTNEEEFPYDASAAPEHEQGQAIAASIKRLEKELVSLGPVDWGALSEGESLANRVAYLEEQIEDVRAAVEELRGIIGETDRYVASIFSEALGNINTRFDSLFRRLFGGGEARLQLTDPRLSPEDEDDDSPRQVAAEWDRGVEIVARPPGKHLQYLAQLSGGEQTLTAIAYLFASMEAAGVPLAVLDEVDAALDESNLLRFGELAREYARPGGVQLIAMTHRRATMERADILYGVTLDEPGLSKVVGIRVEDWVESGSELAERSRRSPAPVGRRP